jgi:hypothetical protein
MREKQDHSYDDADIGNFKTRGVDIIKDEASECKSE